MRLKGEQGEGANEKDSFAAKPVWQRVIILAAGVLMNLFLTIIIFTATLSIGMPQVLEDGTTSAKDSKIEITSVLSKSPAEAAGIQPGDVLQSLDSSSFADIASVQAYVRDHVGVPISLSLLRGSERVTVSAIPTILKESGKPGFGVALARVGIVSYPLPTALVKSVELTGVMAYTIVTTLANAIRHFAFDGFVGPVGIAATTATVTKLGFSYLLNLIAQLSLSLAIFNFLPIPALDGGRVFFALLEKTRGKSLEPAIENAIHLLGFVVLITLLIMVTVRDITKLFAS